MDDNLKSLEKRFKTFEDITIPVIKEFENKDLVREIDGEKEKTEVFKELI